MRFAALKTEEQFGLRAVAQTCDGDPEFIEGGREGLTSDLQDSRRLSGYFLRLGIREI
jgi:hypothetical protein